MELIPGEIYYDLFSNEDVEFGYMGDTGKAIVYEPGDSGGGMQSSWAVDPKNLISKKENKENKISNLCCGDSFHKFEPRYDEIEEFNSKKKIYVCDICSQCGIRIERNNNPVPPPPIPPPNRRIKENEDK